MKKPQLQLSIGFLLCVSAIPYVSVYAYEVDTHAQITRESLARSVLSDALTLRRIGLYPELEATLLLRPDNGVYESSWSSGAGARADLLTAVAVRKEDHGIRSIQHFFDPENDTGLALTDAATGESIVIGLRSHQWASNRESEWTDVPAMITPSEQYFTAEHAKDYFEEAILGQTRELRFRRYGQFLTSIGHVIHHVQDMSQPDHARNDPHCNTSGCAAVDALIDIIPGISIEEAIYDPSNYEPFVKGQGYATFNQWDYPIPEFDSYKSYWTNAQHSGMADFTNRFAISKDTNFRGSLHALSNHPEFPYPDGANATTAEEVTSVTLMDGIEVSYTRTAVRASYRDAYLGSSPSNDHITATRSLFSLDIETAELLGYDVSAVSDAGFSMGRDVYLSAADKLLPRAEAYSAGLINFMLRGRLGVRLPDRGHYALTDFAPGNAFTFLIFQLRNETPDVQPLNQASIPQDVGAGEIVAVVSYRPNPCYEDDLSGELHPDEPGLIPSGCTWETWSSTDEIRVLSAPVSVSNISRDWTEYEFDFLASPIPFSARDIEVYFVFRGDLGSEQDAIIVERKNISEPTYYTTFNSSDWVWTRDGWEDGYALLTNDDGADDIIAAQYHDISYDYDGTNPYQTGPDTLEAGHFHRIVALVDPDSDYTLRYQNVPERYFPSAYAFSWNPLLNETREVKGRRTIHFNGFEIHGPWRYSNQWCDDQGCTLSGLIRWRGFSRWSMLRQYYLEGDDVPDPASGDWEELGSKPGMAQQPVTIHE